MRLALIIACLAAPALAQDPGREAEAAGYLLRHRQMAGERCRWRSERVIVEQGAEMRRRQELVIESQEEVLESGDPAVTRVATTITRVTASVEEDEVLVSWLDTDVPFDESGEMHPSAGERAIWYGMVGTRVVAVLDDDRDVLALDGIDALRERMLARIPEGDRLSRVLVERRLDADRLKSEAAELYAWLPELPVELGGSWSKESTEKYLDGMLVISRRTEYTLAGAHAADPGSTTLDIDFRTATSGDSQVQGESHEGGEGEGRIRFALERGHLLELEQISRSTARSHGAALTTETSFKLTRDSATAAGRGDR